jgi:3-oxoacyl-[acyl-carrier-protein] synthase II
MGAVSPFGSSVDDLLAGLYQNRSAVCAYPDMAAMKGLRSFVAAKVTGVDATKIARKHRRSMSAMSVYAVLAVAEALYQGAVGAEECASGRLGVAVGSTLGSTAVSEEFFEDFSQDHSMERMKTTLFFKLMNHTCAANIAQTYAISGRIMAPAAACSTASQAIGYGYETIAAGYQDMMLCGGADEHHPLTTATFDVMNAASVAYNDNPHQTPRPFAVDRDGMVCGEGSGILLLESLESAQRRGVKILGEVVGFATLTDTGNIANPDADIMAQCMRLAINNAGIEPAQIDYVNAHATATEQGDIAESQAIAAVVGEQTPVSSLKGHIGHTLAASGALESIATLDMLNTGRLVPTLNLAVVDSRCAALNYLRVSTQPPAPQPINYALKNNFALGGVNTSLVFRRYTCD